MRDEITRIRVRRSGKLRLVQIGSNGSVKRLLPQEILQGIHDNATLIVMDVLLVLHQHQWHLTPPFRSAAHQITVHFVLEELFHGFLTVFLLHHHQRRILTHRFTHQHTSLHISTDDLMRPPLMGDFMRRYIKWHIDGIFLVLHLGDKPDGL